MSIMPVPSYNRCIVIFSALDNMMACSLSAGYQWRYLVCLYHINNIIHGQENRKGYSVMEEICTATNQRFPHMTERSRPIAS